MKLISKLIIAFIAPIVTFFAYMFINSHIGNLWLELVFALIINIFVIALLTYVHKFFVRYNMKIFFKNVIITAIISSCFIVAGWYLILWSASQLSQ